MVKDNAIELARFRLEQSRECLTVAETNLETSLNSSINRSYYSVFHAMRAVLALDRFESKTHKGVINEFRRRYIKTEVFPRHFSDIIEKAFDVRGDSDYSDFFLVDESEVRQQLDNATEFLKAVESYLNPLLEAQP